MKTAVQFGAGNIGRGFMGQLFWEAGYKTVFVEANESIVELLNTHTHYPLKILDAYTKKEIDLNIDNFEGLHVDDTMGVVEAVSTADVMSTAVGVNNLSAIAPVIARGVEMRYIKSRRPVDIYLCENILDAADSLKSGVMQAIDKATVGWAEENVGFIGTVVGRMVPSSSDRFGVDHPLFVVADSYHHLPYDGMALKSKPPEIEGMKAVRNFQAEVERKLFTHNLGHAVLGYLGYLGGYSFVHEPFDDERISSIFDGALNETSHALLRKFPDDLDPDEHRAILKDVHIRFGNPMIQDTVQRVARDPIRKLGPRDRLIGSAHLCLSNGVFPKYIAYTCGAALCYDYDQDEKAVQLQEMLCDEGVEAVLMKLSNVDPQSEFGKEIVRAYYELREKNN
jgi:mannitol-1-phosphate 5-dehydrogenase